MSAPARSIRSAFDLLKDLTPVAPLTSAALWLIGGPNVPANNLKELIDWLKANPDKAHGAAISAPAAARSSA